MKNLCVNNKSCATMVRFRLKNKESKTQKHSNIVEHTKEWYFVVTSNKNMQHWLFNWSYIESSNLLEWCETAKQCDTEETDSKILNDFKTTKATANEMHGLS